MLRLNPECVSCMLKRYLKQVPESFNQEQKLEYMQTICRIIGDASKEQGAPVVVQAIKHQLQLKYGFTEDFSKEKQYFNHMMLEREADITTQVQQASDSLKLALQYSMTGNYIDFGSMNVVDEEYLSKSLASTSNRPINDVVYEALKKDLSSAKKLVLITDNCGEIVLDKILLKTIKRLYPQLEIIAMVRGGEILNDATMKDAIEVGMTDLVNVIHNGTDIAGTCLEALSREATEVLNAADIILSKGQANFETLRGCGKNIYYIFLCKCDMFSSRFGVEKYTGMLINDMDYRKSLGEE